MLTAHTGVVTGARVIVLMAQAAEGGRLIKDALDVNLGGEGFMWL